MSEIRKFLVGLLTTLILFLPIASQAQQTDTLYETCKSDLQQPDFAKTSCSRYLEGFKDSLGISTIFLLSAKNEPQSNNKTLDKLNAILSNQQNCKKEGRTTHRIATDLIKFVDEQKPREITELQTYLWAHILTCGEPHQLMDELK